MRRTALAAFLFLSAPIFSTLLELDRNAVDEHLRHRREEHVRLVLASLRPDADPEPAAKPARSSPRKTR